MSSSLDNNESINRRKARQNRRHYDNDNVLHLHSKTFPQKIPKQGPGHHEEHCVAVEMIMSEMKQKDIEGSYRKARNGASLPELDWKVQV